MRYNIMLLFLSNAHWNNAQNEISESNYKGLTLDEEKKVCTQMTNESAIRWLLSRLEEDGETLSKLFLYATNTVRNEPVSSEKKADGAVPERYRDKDGRILTHLEYFKKIIAPLVKAENIDRFVVDEAIDEKGDTDAMLNQTVAMAEKIKEYCVSLRKKDQNAEIVLHADFTGGLRHANLMMLILTRLLQYQELEMGHILYSNYLSRRKVNWVDDVTDVYRLFDLVSGTAEFARFGSADILTKYYEDVGGNNSDELRKLIRAMQSFANQTKLCHYGDMKKAIEGLHSAAAEFEKHVSEVAKKAGEDRSKAETNDALMGVMNDEINRMYRPLFEKAVSRDIDDVELIRWCVEHNYLQQALTFYTERVPELFCYCDKSESEEKRNDYIVPTQKGVNVLAGIFKNQDVVVSREYYLFTTLKNADFDRECDKKNKAAKREFIKTIKDNFFAKMLNPYGKTPDSKQPKAVKEIIKDFFKQPEHQWTMLADEERTINVLEKIRGLWQNPKVVLDGKDPFLGELIEACYGIESDTKSREAWDKEYSACKYGAMKFGFLMKCLMSVSVSNPSKLTIFNNFVGELTYRYSAQCYGLFEGGLIKTRIPWEEMLPVLDTYGKLKAERNSSNHAHDERSRTTEESLGNLLLDGINNIDRVRKAYGDKPFVEKIIDTEENECKKRVFVNYTNHPSDKWSKAQLKAARDYGEVIDMPFPDISPNASESDISSLAEKACQKLEQLSPAAVLCQGEFSFVYQIVRRMTKRKIPVLAACSERIVAESTDENGVTHRTSEFKFVQFRQYEKV